MADQQLRRALAEDDTAAIAAALHGVHLAGLPASSVADLLSRARSAAAVQALVEAGASVTALGQHERSTVLLATRRGHDVAAATLLALGADAAATDRFGDTALHQARSAAAVAQLEAAGAPVDAANQLGFTPLHAAAESGRHDVVEALLGCGADPTRRASGGRLPWHLAATPELASALRPHQASTFPVRPDTAIDPLCAGGVGNTIVVGGRDGLLCRAAWDGDHWTRRVVQTGLGDIEVVLPAPEGGLMVLRGWPGGPWQIRRADGLRFVEDVTVPDVTAAAWSADGDLLLYGPEDTLWKLTPETGLAVARHCTDRRGQHVPAMAVSPRGDRLARAVLDQGSAAVAVCALDHALTPQLDLPRPRPHDLISDITWSPDGRTLAWVEWTERPAAAGAPMPRVVGFEPDTASVRWKVSVAADAGGGSPAVLASGADGVMIGSRSGELSVVSWKDGTPLSAGTRVRGSIVWVGWLGGIPTALATRGTSRAEPTLRVLVLGSG